MDETKVIYHIDDEDTPYLVKLPKSPTDVKLGDFKNILNRPTYKFFFKSMDDDFGVVKEEISDDEKNLPCFNGRVVAWLVTSDTSSISDKDSSRGPLDSDQQSVVTSSDLHVPVARTAGIGDSRPPSYHPHGGGHSTAGDFDSEADSTISSRRQGSRSRRHGSRDQVATTQRTRMQGGVLGGRRDYETGSSDLETTSFIDSEDDRSSVSRFSSTTESSHLLKGRHRRRRRRPRMPRVQRCSSFSTITESTMSLNIITVTLNMDKVNFLGISIVGQSNKRGDGGIYVGSIMKGGAVDLDGRIEPGDMLLQVNDVNFENMSNDDAVRVLREMVHKPGPITLTVAKCWDPTPKGYFTLPHGEPVRPIDTSAWVQHTTVMNQFAQQTGQFGKPPINSQSLGTMTSTSSSMTSSLPESDLFVHDRKEKGAFIPGEEVLRLSGFQDVPDGEALTLNTDMVTVVKAMAAPDSGLDIRDRMWLKITIPNAFIGSDVVDWLYSHVEGFADRREARKYACNLLKVCSNGSIYDRFAVAGQTLLPGTLCAGTVGHIAIDLMRLKREANVMGKAGYIRHTVNKITFSEQCYYVFGDLCGNMARLTLHDHDGSDQDTLAPLPQHNPGMPWMGQPPSYGYQPMPMFVPPTGHADTQTPGYAHSFYSSHSGSNSPHSASGSSKRSGGDNRGDRQDDHRSSGGSSSERSGSSRGTTKEKDSHNRSSAPSERSLPPIRPLDQVPDNVAASRNSFRMAMGDPCEFFVDVM